MQDAATMPAPPTHVLSQLGFAVRRDGDDLVGTAAIDGSMTVPGTGLVRTSLLAAWTDTLTGLLAVDRVQPRVPVTLHLEVDLIEPPVGLERLVATARVDKAGGRTITSSVELADPSGQVFGLGSGTFVLAGDDSLRMPAELDTLLERMDGSGAVSGEPFARRAGCTVEAPGRAAIDFAPERSNASGTLSGALLALLVEEAALSVPATPPTAVLSSLSMRYLSPVRTGPAVAIAEVVGEGGPVTSVEVTDEGRGVLAARATTRTFDWR